MVSPWAWAGWVVAAAIAMLYYKLWTSASVKELDGLRRELEKARKTIAELRELELRLKNRNEELSTAHHKLHSEFTELRGKHSQLHAAHGALGELVASLREDLDRERQLRDTQYAELMREKAKHGEL